MSPGGNTDARNMLFYNSSSTKIKFQIFTSENFVLAGRMCSDLFYPLRVLASITMCITLDRGCDVTNNASITASSANCYHVKIITVSSEQSSYDIKEPASDGSLVKLAYSFSHWTTWKLRYQMVKKDADSGTTDADSHY